MNEQQGREERRLIEVGWEGLSDCEVLTLLLLPGNHLLQARRKAQGLLEHVGPISRIKGKPYRSLKRSGLTHRQVLAVSAAFQLARRASLRAIPSNNSFHSSLEIFRYFRPVVADLKKECFWTLLFDGKNRVLRIVKISEGCLTRSMVHPREVFRPAIVEAAAAILFVHNHPSGEPRPSQEDIQITQRLVETGRVVGISVLDHVIMGRYRYFSFADEGMM